VTAALKLDLSARAFALAMLATAVVVAGAGWFLMIAPKHHKASTLATEIQSAQAQLSAARQAVAKAKAAQRPVLEAALPSELQMPEILDQLNALATRADVRLDTVTPATAVAGAGYYAEPLSVVVEGRFFGVQKFLQLVRNQVSLGKTKLSASGRLLGVSSVQLSETPPTVTGTLQMTAYYFVPNAAAPTPVTSTTSTTSGP
jgi:Tfp pilus assembly protein PilO